jgi:hypothetical protein
MPDSVRCSVDTSQGHHTVNCEVDFDPAPSASTASSAPLAAAPASNAAPPAAQSPAPPAVAALVNRFVLSRHEVHAPAVEQVTLNSAQACAGQLMALPLLGLRATLPLSVLGGFKLGYDLGACLGKNTASRQAAADEAAAVQDCEADGGIPTGTMNNALMCLEPGAVTP